MSEQSRIDIRGVTKLYGPVRAVNNVDLTIRVAQQVLDKTGGYAFKGLRVVERGRVKEFKPGKVEKGADDYTVRYVFPDPYFLLPDVLARSVATSNAPDDEKAGLIAAQLAEKSLPMLGLVCHGGAPPGAVQALQDRLVALGYLGWSVEPGVFDDHTRLAATRLFAYGM